MNVVVWGLGRHSIKNILPSIKETKVLNLYGLVSRNKEALKKCSNDFDCKYWTNPEEMLLDSKVDIVYVSTPPGLHFNQGLRIISSQKHFWCEKPITTNLIDLEELLKLSLNSNLSVNEALMYLHHPHFKKLKELVEKEKLGPLHAIKCSFTLPQLEKPGYRFNKDLGASALLDLGIYPLSIITNLFPDKEIKLLKVNLKTEESGFIDVSGEVELRLGNNISCLLDWSYDRNYKNEISIEGEMGSLTTEKIFSKDSDYSPKIKLNISNQLSVIDIESANHFKLMLELFSSNIAGRANLSQVSRPTLTLYRLISDVLKNNSLKID